MRRRVAAQKMHADRFPPSEHYSFEPIGERTTFARARPEGTALSNAGLIDLGGSTLVFDTSLTLRAAQDLRAASIAATGRPPSLSANSHWHLDHMLGNQVFADHPIYASQGTIETLRRRKGELLGEISREKLETEIRVFEGRLGAAKTEAVRAMFDSVLRIRRALLSETGELKFTLPTRGFEEELRLEGNRDARLLTFGSGHTESDAVLFLSRERILCAGDLVLAQQHPNLTSGNPEHWLTVLDKLAALRPEHVVTGHGPIGSLESVADMRDYLATILDLANSKRTVEIPDRFRNWKEPEQFADNLEFLRGHFSAGSR